MTGTKGTVYKEPVQWLEGQSITLPGLITQLNIPSPSLSLAQCVPTPWPARLINQLLCCIPFGTAYDMFTLRFKTAWVTALNRKALLNLLPLKPNSCNQGWFRVSTPRLTSLVFFKNTRQFTQTHQKLFHLPFLEVSLRNKPLLPSQSPTCYDLTKRLPDWGKGAPMVTDTCYNFCTPDKKGGDCCQ